MAMCSGIANKREKNCRATTKPDLVQSCNKELSLRVIDEAPDGRVPVKHNASRTVTSEIPVAS